MSDEHNIKTVIQKMISLRTAKFSAGHAMKKL
jgi:hypothetical protein